MRTTRRAPNATPRSVATRTAQRQSSDEPCGSARAGRRDACRTTTAGIGCAQSRALPWRGATPVTASWCFATPPPYGEVLTPVKVADLTPTCANAQCM